MNARLLASMFGLVGLVFFVVLRPESPTAGSDCEVLATGWLREPLATVSSLAIVAAGWWAARHRPIAGTAVLLAGLASLAAHATAHPTARVLDGLVASMAVVVVVVSLVRTRPTALRLLGGAVVGGLAVAVWVLTRTDAALCSTVGPWGHAAWHLLVAGGVVVVARGPDAGEHPHDHA